MSISSVTSQVSNAEQYVIRSAKREQTSQPEQQVQQVQQVQTDEYDKGNPVGERAEGIYSVSHDDEGRLKVNYTQPSEKTTKAEAKSEAGNAGNGKSAGSAESSEDDEEEIERLKKQRDALKAQLNRETDEEVKRTLRLQLQSIEVQIAMKNSGVN